MWIFNFAHGPSMSLVGQISLNSVILPSPSYLLSIWSFQVLNELTQALDYLETSSDTRVIVLVWPPLHEAMTAITESEHEGDFREHPPDVCAGRISPTHRLVGDYIPNT